MNSVIDRHNYNKIPMVRNLTGTLIYNRLFKKALIAFMVIFFFLSAPTLGSQESEHKTILILYSFGHVYPATAKWDHSLRSVLDTQQDLNININTEYLDLSRYNELDYIQMMVDIFRYKYSSSQPDLIITVFEPAFEFVIKYGEELFPRVPIVFGGIERLFAENQNLNPNITGVYQGANAYKETLELALNLHPNTRQVVVVAGAGLLEQSWLLPAQKTFQQYEDRIDITYLEGLSIDEIQNKVEKLSTNTLVLFFPVLEDYAGKTYIAVNVLSKISEASSVPVYSFWDIMFGQGMVGGYLKSFPIQAQTVADMGLHILRGVPIEDLPAVQKMDLKFMFDWRQLKRWSISEDKLPSGSIIEFIEYSFWDKYIDQIIIISVLIFLQTLIISYLLVQRRMRRQSQKELLQAEQKYKTVADYTYDWEYWQNPDGSIKYMSPSCERISGYNTETFIKKPFMIQDIVIPADKEIWDKHRCNIQNGRNPEGIQYRIQRPDGEIRWIEHTCQPVIDHQGNNLGVRASNRDITETERYKSATHKLQSELIHMERIVTISTLTYALAHEINQPLTSIRSYAQAALRFMDKDQPEDENIRNALQGIVTDNKRAAAVVNHLRDLVKKETVHSEALQINSIIKDVLDLINSEIILRNASIKLDLDPTVPVVNGDSIQIQQVLINLLTNALDAMNEQTVETRTITISTSPENSTGTIISISDSGRGISPDKLNEIFEPFHTTKPKGLGMGLAICKSIIEDHGGKIWADNNPNGGAMFSFFLPEIGKIE